MSYITNEVTKKKQPFTSVKCTFSILLPFFSVLSLSWSLSPWTNKSSFGPLFGFCFGMKFLSWFIVFAFVMRGWEMRSGKNGNPNRYYILSFASLDFDLYLDVVMLTQLVIELPFTI